MESILNDQPIDIQNRACSVQAGQDHCHLMAVVNYITSVQNSLIAALAAAAFLFDS